jgi:hypothetical protein
MSTASPLTIAAETLHAAAATREEWAEGPADGLGVGHDPTDELAAARRATLRAGSAILEALARYAEAAEKELAADGATPAEHAEASAAQVRRIARAASAVCSATAETLAASVPAEEE